MIQPDMAEAAYPHYRRDLGDGLILRWSTKADTDAIVQLMALTFRDSPNEPPNQPLASFMRELMSNNHPTMNSGDVALVEDTYTGKLAAATCLWRQRWAYEDIPFDVGRPEIVAANADYRNRGLVRAVFELIHARSEQEGHLAQGITGIPYFYRQFGYEYALDLDIQRTTPFALIPKTKEGVVEPYTLRHATQADIPFIQKLYARQCTQVSIYAPIPETWWSHHIEAMKTNHVSEHWIIYVVVDTEDRAQGYIVLPSLRWRQSIPVFDIMLTPDTDWYKALPPIMRALQGPTMQLPSRAEPISKIRWQLRSHHPVYQVLSKELALQLDRPYAWYVRVPDLPRFLQHIAPALEARLANSIFAKYSGELRITFYRGGLHLVFEKGTLTKAENWKSPIWNTNENAGFPPLVFLQLLFGRRSLDELRYAFADVWCNQEVELLLKTLFPEMPTWVLPLG